jgi:hypothetical protein
MEVVENLRGFREPGGTRGRLASNKAAADSKAGLFFDYLLRLRYAASMNLSVVQAPPWLPYRAS